MPADHRTRPMVKPSALSLSVFLVSCVLVTTAFGQGNYAPHELLVTFAEQYMPSEENVSNASPAAFGISFVDSLLLHYECTELTKLIPSWNEFQSPSGRRIERTFLLKFDENADILTVAEDLEQAPQFESVELNWIVFKEYFGTAQEFPPTTTAFANQWNLHHPQKDRLDIDAPEAWAIEKGTPNTVIVIHDTGTMVDTSTTNIAWKLHSDFGFYWTDEDMGGQLALNRADLDFDDSNLDGVIDNVIGYNWSPHYRFETDDDIIRFWHSIPMDWLLPTSGTSGFITGSQCVAMFLHGTFVASVAAAGFGAGAGAPAGGDATGVAPGLML